MVYGIDMDCSLSPTTDFGICLGARPKVASDSGKAIVFTGYPGFHHLFLVMT